MTVSFHLQQNIDYVNYISETILYNQFIISSIITHYYVRWWRRTCLERL